MSHTSPILGRVRRNWQIVAVAVLIAGVIILLEVLFFQRGQSRMQQQLKDKLRTVAAMSAMQFDGDVIAKISGRSVLATRELRETVARLRIIRSGVPEIRFAYIMRRTDDPSTLEFVADADTLATDAELDRNANGTVEEDEEASFPGDPYDISDVPALRGAAFEGPAVDDDFTVDQWGTLISGYAPIRDSAGAVVAVLGIDMGAEHYLALSKSMFSPLLYLIITCIAVLLGSMVAAYLWRRRIEFLERMHRERSGLMLLTMHQIGSPLTILQWSIEQLLEQRGTATINKAIDEHAHNIRQASTLLNDILDELQRASSVDAGTLLYKSEWVSLTDVINGVLAGLSPALRARGQSITVAADPSLELSLDRALITGVIRELLQNAMTFSPDGGLITVRADRQRSDIRIRISDAGCGIAKADLPRIFDKFTRGANAHLYRPNGSGLGLYIAQGIIRRAGGEIWVESVEGSGTTVTFTLPC